MNTRKNDVEIANDELNKIKKRKRSKSPPRVAGEESPFICKTEIFRLIPVSNSTLYLMMGEGRFPRQKSLGGNIAVWSRVEVMKWINEKLN